MAVGENMLMIKTPLKQAEFPFFAISKFGAHA